jgi:hypothetical protein
LQGVGNTCLQGGGAGAGQEGGADTGHPGQERSQGGGDQAPGSSLTLFTWVTKFEKSSHCYPIGEIKWRKVGRICVFLGFVNRVGFYTVLFN